MNTPISSIRNLGPAYEEACRQAGIASAEELRAIGADAAYAKLLETGTRPHFIGYYVLVMALQGRPWNDCKGTEKEELRKRFDAIKAETRPQHSSALLAELDAIGVRATPADLKMSESPPR
ncbi:competence protein TfoX [Rhodobacteraceae bacterium (ex Bugula neritina AB1)]|nr:competence protein TfoX [Rhodobacteraceae bacterium (ex Bugula neritina AB1)]